MFKYSIRERTKAATMGPNVQESIKQKRLTQLIERQNVITREKNEELVGKTVPILIENKNRHDHSYLGRTKNNKIVIIKEPVKIGETKEAFIKTIDGWTLIGELKGGEK